jgi:N-methylhydantoinase A
MNALTDKGRVINNTIALQYVRQRLVERFHREHERRYGFSARETDVEIVTVEVRGALPGERLPRAGRVRREGRAERVLAWSEGRRVRTMNVPAASLAPGDRVRGPAIVSESGATLWVAPDWSGRVHASGAIVLERGRR